MLEAVNNQLTAAVQDQDPRRAVEGQKCRGISVIGELNRCLPMEIEEFMVFCAAVSYFPVNFERFRAISEASLRESEGIRANGVLSGKCVLGTLT